MPINDWKERYEQLDQIRFDDNLKLCKEIDALRTALAKEKANGLWTAFKCISTYGLNFTNEEGLSCVILGAVFSLWVEASGENISLREALERANKEMPHRIAALSNLLTHKEQNNVW